MQAPEPYMPYLPPLSSSPSFFTRLPLAVGALALALGMAGCSIILPDARVAQSAEASAAVPPPPEDSTLTPGQRQGLSDPIQGMQTYRGVIPCADCAGQRVTLTLLPDWTYRLRRVYFGTRDNKDISFVTTGRWERSVDNTHQITLIGDRNDSSSYEFVQGNALRLLDQNGEPIRSALNYSLTQQFDPDAIAESFTMRGRVTTNNGVSTVAICSTGKRYTVAQTGNPQVLADAYSRLRIAPGTPVLMWIEGRIVSAGQPPQEQLQVDAMAQGTLDAPCDN
jgi:copper homeostasis protein (lipoprotein)